MHTPHNDADLPSPLFEGLALAQADHEVAVLVCRDMFHLIAGLGRELGLVVGELPHKQSYGYHFHSPDGQCLRSTTERCGMATMAETIMQGLRAWADQVLLQSDLRTMALVTALSTVGFDISEYLGGTWGDSATSQDARVRMAEVGLREKIGKYMALARTGAVEQYKREQARAAQQEGQPDAQTNTDMDSDR